VKIDTVMSCTGCAVKWTQGGENRKTEVAGATL